LTEFFKNSYLGRVITVSELEAKRKLWFYHGQNFSVACFIGAAALDQRMGPRLLVRDFNKNNDRLKLGYLTPISHRFAGLPRSSAEVTQFKIELKKFEESAESFHETKDFLILFRQVSPSLVALSYVNKARVLFEPAQKAHFAFFALLKWLIILGFVCYCGFLRFPGMALSVQQKMLFLLLFANGLPALILVSTGYEYFSEKKAALIDQQQQESIRILKEFDSRYPGARANFAGRLNSFIDKRNAKFADKTWPDEELQSLKKHVFELDPGQISLVTDKDTLLHSFNKSGNEDENQFYRKFFQRSLAFLNNHDLKRRGDAAKSTLEAISSEDQIFLYFISFLDHITLQNTGMGWRWVYVKLLGDSKNYKNWGFLGVLWTPDEFMRSFFLHELESAEKDVFPRRIGMMQISTERAFPDRFNDNSAVKRLLHLAVSQKLILNNDLKIDGKSYLFTALAGTEMGEGILLALYPRVLIENEIFHFKLALFLIGLVVLFVLVQIVRLFSRRLLLPVEGLANGIDAIRQRDFRYRVNFESDDELGKLIKAFNSNMESLQELAVGTAVQEGLLPESHYAKDKIRLFARSVFMTKMGGDYFDYFESQPGRLGIIFGDVAGHGIPAAMIMAMAKAVIASSSINFKTPADMLLQVNSALAFLRERKLRRMMTCQCLDLDCRTGEIVLANAGHCYPIRVSRNGAETSFVEICGVPLGNRQRKPYDEVKLQLIPGETLVLYTDGIVEATNSKGEMFDYQRFNKLLKNAWHEDLETYWKNIIEVNKTWATSQDDDLTFMLIRYEND
jgi:hypothetical protein